MSRKPALARPPVGYVNYHGRWASPAIRYISDLLRYRHLCWNLVGSDLRSRFRRSYLGLFWAMLQPIGYSLVIAWAWHTIFKSEDFWAFGLYVFSGMLVWEYFSTTTMSSLDSLINSAGYLRQARVPLFVFQIRAPLSGIVIFYIGVAGLLLMQLALGKLPPLGLHLLLIPAYGIVLLAFFIPVALLLSVVGTQLRDLKHIMTLGIQVLFFLSPVMMDRGMMDQGQLIILTFLNPLVPLIDMIRDPALYGVLWQRSDVISIAIWTALIWFVAIVTMARTGRKVVFAV